MAKRLRLKSIRLDKTDEQILRALALNGRVSVAELARKAKLSPPTVSERIKRLEESGVITGYTILINPEAFGRPVSTWIRISPLPGQLPKVAKVLKSLDDIVECDRITGDDCFLARADLASMKHLEELIDKLLPYAKTNTSLIQSSPVSRRLPPIASHALVK